MERGPKRRDTRGKVSRRTRRSTAVTDPQRGERENWGGGPKVKWRKFKAGDYGEMKISLLQKKKIYKKNKKTVAASPEFGVSTAARGLLG